MAATQKKTPAPTPGEVANLFVNLYYNALCHSPSDVSKFYISSSVVRRLGSPSNVASYAPSSLDCEDFKILSVDAQRSFDDGVFILVTGLMTAKDNTKKTFCQSFLLAPTERPENYVIVNDIFRYVDEADHVAEKAAPAPDPGVQAPPISSSSDNSNQVLAGKCDTQELIPAAEAARASPTKKSYSSVLVKALKEEDAPFVMVAPRAAIPVPESNRKSKGKGKGIASRQESSGKSKGGSIFVGNLPMTATPEELHEAFKSFGAIKPNGVQVRTDKEKRCCYGFVDFEAWSSVERAAKASVTIGDRKANIEMKQTNADRNRRLPPGNRAGNDK